jgi:hypothetical protein
MVFNVIPKQYVNCLINEFCLLGFLQHPALQCGAVCRWAVCVTSDAAAAVAMCLYQPYSNVSFLFSAHIKDAVETDCAKCSETQRKGAEKILVFLHKNKPEKFSVLQDKYDPDRSYYNKHESLFNGSGSS